MIRQLLFRRSYLGICGLIFLLSCSSGDRTNHDENKPGSKAGKAPNILFVITDDQRWDMMGNVNVDLHTPEMDRLAEEGLRFENAFVTTSICAASRASMLTGLVERSHGFTFITPPLASQFTDASFPAILRKEGYRTGHIGKFGVKVEDGAIENMYDVYEELNRNPYFKEDESGLTRHLTDIIGDRSKAFLESNPEGQPFALTVSFNAPHAEDSDERQFIWPEAVDHLYKELTIPAPPLSEPTFFDGQPEFMRDPDQSMNRFRWHWRFDNPEKSQEMTKGYYRMISGVDAVIGRLRMSLEELGLADNTVIVMMGDNGYFLGDRGFAGKWLPYDPSLRVPLLIYDPRDPELSGGRPEGLALNIDIAPTILGFAGLAAPESMQGESLFPLRDIREDFFVEHLMDHKQIVKHEGVRSKRYRYSRYFQLDPVYEELYDLESDPLETKNLVDSEDFAELLAKYRTRTDELRDQFGGPWIKPSGKSAMDP